MDDFLDHEKIEVGEHIIAYKPDDDTLRSFWSSCDVRSLVTRIEEQIDDFEIDRLYAAVKYINDSTFDPGGMIRFSNQVVQKKRGGGLDTYVVRMYRSFYDSNIIVGASIRYRGFELTESVLLDDEMVEGLLGLVEKDNRGRKYPLQTRPTLLLPQQKQVVVPHKLVPKIVRIGTCDDSYMISFYHGHKLKKKWRSFEFSHNSQVIINGEKNEKGKEQMNQNKALAIKEGSKFAYLVEQQRKIGIGITNASVATLAISFYSNC